MKVRKMHPNGSVEIEEITLGEPICLKLKEAFFFDQPWSPEVANAVAKKFTEFKKISRELLPHLDQPSFLRELSKFTLKDIIETFTDMK